MDEQYKSGYEIYFSQVECAKYLLREKNYTGQQLDSITELKKRITRRNATSTYQSRTINDFLIR
jgi:hypothetical protein